MLTPDGKVRLADLGLARALAGGESALTNPESVVGTWEYISPEQALGVQIVPESDLYSFGIVLYEMLRRLRFSHLRLILPPSTTTSPFFATIPGVVTLRLCAQSIQSSQRAEASFRQ